ncbi:MAG: galactokinase [Candidatus Omnitrophica bacterium]|nr:galactokinase [Candidatus Omnitrophota bacterium]
MSVDLGQLRQEFSKRFDKQAVWGASAPGRVNLIGEHIDYNGGWVLPAAINRGTTIIAGPSRSERFSIQSLSFEQGFEWEDGELPEGPVEPAWANYFVGAYDQMVQRGYKIPPIEVLIATDIPIASGLSSSAAILVAIYTLFEAILRIQIPGPEKALWSQAAEHAERLRIRSGIMDQFISANAISGHALKLNCGTLDFKPVPLDPEKVSILIIHSTVARELVISAYNQRRLECEEGLKLLNEKSGREEEWLVGYSLEEFETLSDGMDETLKKRARHVISEQARVERFEEAFSKDLFDEGGRLLAESHISLRDDYEVSCQELDAIQEIASGLEGVYGCRMTGAGFGGCAVSLVQPDAVNGVATRIEEDFEKRMGKRPWTLISPATEGARKVL